MTCDVFVVKQNTLLLIQFFLNFAPTIDSIEDVFQIKKNMNGVLSIFLGTCNFYVRKEMFVANFAYSKFYSMK